MGFLRLYDHWDKESPNEALWILLPVERGVFSCELSVNAKFGMKESAPWVTCTVPDSCDPWRYFRQFQSKSIRLHPPHLHIRHLSADPNTGHFSLCGIVAIDTTLQPHSSHQRSHCNSLCQSVRTQVSTVVLPEGMFLVEICVCFGPMQMEWQGKSTDWTRENSAPSGTKRKLYIHGTYIVLPFRVLDELGGAIFASDIIRFQDLAGKISGIKHVL